MRSRRFGNTSGSNAPMGLVIAWEVCQVMSKNILKGKPRFNLKRVQEAQVQTCCRISESNGCIRVVFGNPNGSNARMGLVILLESDLKDLHELRGKRLVAQVSQTRRFALYSRTGLVFMLRLESSWHGRSVDHVLTCSRRQIAVGSRKPSRITRQKLVAQSGFDAPIGVVSAGEERGSCLNIFRTTNRDRISETFMNYEAEDLLRKNLHELRGKRLVGQVSQTRRFANRSGFDAPIGVVLAWEERGSCLNVFQMTDRVGISKTSRITRQKTCCASESNTSVRVVFANRSGFDAPIGVVLAWEERGSCLNMFRMTNRSRISETFINYEAQDLLRKSHKPSRITRQKTCCTSESNTSVRVVFPNQSGFDAPIGVFLAWEERGSCLNIFRTTNHDRISETFTNYEAKDLLRKNLHELRGERLVGQVSQTRRFALYSRTGVVLMLRLESSWHGRSVDHVLTYFGRQIAVRSQKPSRITRQKTCCATESNTSVRVVFANRSGFDAPIGVVLAWEEFGSCLNIFRMTNLGRISETFKNYEAKDLLRKSVDLVITYSGRQIAVRSQKPSRTTRQKVRVVIANRSGFDAPIGFVLPWEERGSCLNMFRMTNRGQISETITNYEAKGSRCNREPEWF
ncbi:uncharacterized protein G2W53_009899 [Senna tora]|uniref:Uncharacterized protein n=1 Tax=Senna tora TaxID=362788 RepID=A0A834WYA8_9FABA|nr:uncharacterized protein G2W53_009899 [Senna tora]